MSELILPHSLQSGTPENVDHVQQNFEAIRDLVNGQLDAANLVDLGITTAKLADLAVSTVKLANLVVTSAKLADLAVTTAKLNDLAVTAGKLADQAVTAPKMGVPLGSHHPSGPMTRANISVAADLAFQRWTIQIVVSSRATLTGVAYRVGNTSSGSVRVGLYDSAGTRVAVRTTNHAVPLATDLHEVPFDSPVTVDPGVYFAVLVNTSSSFTFHGAFPHWPSSGWDDNGGTANLPATITPPTSGSNGSRPVMSTY